MQVVETGMHTPAQKFPRRVTKEAATVARLAGLAENSSMTPVRNASDSKRSVQVMNAELLATGLGNTPESCAKRSITASSGNALRWSPKAAVAWFSSAVADGFGPTRLVRNGSWAISEGRRKRPVASSQPRLSSR